MLPNGCVGNYANQLAERSANKDWQIRTAMDLVADRICWHKQCQPS